MSEPDSRSFIKNSGYYLFYYSHKMTHLGMNYEFISTDLIYDRNGPRGSRGVNIYKGSE